MPLASDDIVINVSPAITLQPSLRAAYRLERKYGFQKLLQMVSTGSLIAIADVIREGAGESVVTRYLDSLESMSLHIAIDRLIGPCVEFIYALVGVDPDAPEPKSPANQISLEQHYVNLFRFATGWMQWTPDQAWQASPAEIMEAHKGRIEMLIATGVLTKAEDKQDNEETSDSRSTKEQLAKFHLLGDLRNNFYPG